VLDLGSGGGKICYILSQKVGPGGSVVGVDMNDDMLALAEKHREAIAGRIGWSNVEFKKGRIQDLKTDPRAIERRLAERPVTDAASLAEFEEFRARRRAERPLIADAGVDVIVSNCVLNLVRPEDKDAMFGEMHRVLKRGGRAVISDIVADEDIPEDLRNDSDLWSGCISGAYREDLFLKAFERAGFHGVEILKWDAEPWQTVQGIEFRSITVAAYKGKQGPCFEKNQAVVYKGPFSAAIDDDGHRYPRGERVAVCEKTFELLRRGPYADRMIFIEPRVAAEEGVEFDCSRTTLRHPRETKGMDYKATTEAAGSCCGPECC
jgi:SAM-dependent methyltransferase